MPMNLSSILPTYSNNEITCKNFLWIKKAHISLKRKTNNCKNRKIHQTHPSLQDSRMVSWCRGQCYIIFFLEMLYTSTHIGWLSSSFYIPLSPSTTPITETQQFLVVKSLGVKILNREACTDLYVALSLPGTQMWWWILERLVAVDTTLLQC